MYPISTTHTRELCHRLSRQICISAPCTPWPTSGRSPAWAFRTDRYTIKVDIHTDGTWSYEQDTLLIIPGQSEPFHHTDRNRLRKIAEPTPNPTALAARLQHPGTQVSLL
jgi:hypothetical protein